MLTAALTSRPDFGSRPSQQQSVLRAYAGNRAGATEEAKRTTDSRHGGGGESHRTASVEDPDSVLSYRKSGRALHLLTAGEALGRSLDIRV